MNNVSTDNWKEFKIEDIFETKILGGKKQVPTGSWVSTKELMSGAIPRITVSGVNNGIIGYYDSNSINYKVYENFISVSFLGTVFYQQNKASLDMKVHCLKPIQYNLNIYTATFLVTVLKSAISKFTYSDQLSSTTLVNLILKLPAIMINSGKYIPDWEYMESYVKMIETLANKKLNNILEVVGLNNYNKIDTSLWKEFSPCDFFKLLSVRKKLDSSKISTNGLIKVYSSTTENNGVAGYCDENPTYIVDDNIKMYLIFGDHTKSMFIAEESFCVMDNVKVLIPKIQDQNIIRFICTIWQKNIPNLGYARHWKIAKDVKIKLPTTEEGEPNWEYIQNFMSEIHKKTQLNLNNLVNI